MEPPFSSLEDAFKACAEAFDVDGFYDYKTEDGTHCQRQSIMCLIFEALVDDDSGCNALGNNLNEAMEDVMEFLESGPRSDFPKRDIRDYLMRLYLVVERVYEALKVVKLDHERFRLSTDGMRAMRDIKQWANFFKHPGAFLWCHAPTFHCLSIDSPDTSQFGFVVDQAAVNMFYTSDQKRHDELHKKLANATNVHVVFPELSGLTKRFCTGVRDFCESLSAPFFRDVLRRKSTIDDYFKDLAESDAATED